MLPEETNTNISTPQILGDENKIKEEESLSCFVSSVGVSKRGLLSKRLIIAMRTKVKMAVRIQLLQCRKVGIV